MVIVDIVGMGKLIIFKKLFFFIVEFNIVIFILIELRKFSVGYLVI